MAYTLFHSTTSPIALMGEPTTMDGWHCRLSHPHARVLSQVIRNFHLQVSSNKSLPPCTSSQMGKASKFSFPRSLNKCSSVLQLIVCDVWGLLP